MDLYEQLGLNIRPVINAAGPVTMYCGASMPEEVVSAMASVAKLPVRMDELQAAASTYIARITGAEAGYVTCGCSAALMAATAACMTGYDVERINRLPDTSAMPNEVLIATQQRCGYDHAIRASGARIVDVGMPGHYAPGQLYKTLVEDYEAAISERTVAIGYFYYGGGVPALEEVVSFGKKHGLPIILDAANQIPPVENLRRFVSIGVDLVAVSGGKGIRGPQASGLLFGKRDLVAAAALNTFVPGFGAGTVSYEQWSPPPSLIDKQKIRALPHQPICRGQKVSREAIVGLLTALSLLTNEERNQQEMRRLRSLLQPTVESLSEIPGVSLEPGERPAGGAPILTVRIDRAIVGRNVDEILQRLKAAEPPIYVMPPGAHSDQFLINSLSLEEWQARIVADRVRAAIMDE